MGKYYVGARKYLCATKRIVGRNQHWNGKSYPQTSNTYSNPNKRIENTSQITWYNFSTYLHGHPIKGIWIITFRQCLAQGVKPNVGWKESKMEGMVADNAKDHWRTDFKRVWTLFMQMKRPTWMNSLHTSYILRVTSRPAH